jgi:hypothetical protein
MSIFKNIIGSKFKEYSDFVEAIERLRGHGLGIIDSDGKAFDDGFDRFCRSQASTVSPGVTAVARAGKAQTVAMQNLFTKTAGLEHDLSALKRLHENLGKHLSALHSAQELAKKSRSSADRAQEGLTRAEVKGIEAEVQRIRKHLTDAQAKAEDASRAANTCQLAYTQHAIDYKLDFADTFANLLIPVVDAKLEELNELATQAKEFIKATEQISDYEDSCIARLKQRLQELEYQVVE